LPTEKRFEVNYPNILQQIATPITPTSVRKSGKAKKVSNYRSINVSRRQDG